MSVSTYSLLKKALSKKTSKKPETRNKNWVEFQKQAKLKDKGILKQVKKAVENGVSEKRAHDLITVIYSSKKRNLIPDFDVPRNVSLKSSKTSSKSSRFEKVEKRKHDEKVIPRKKYVEDEYQHFPIFSNSKVVAWIGDDVMKFVLAGDYQEVEKRLSAQDAFRTQDGKIRDPALKSSEFAAFVRNSLIEATKTIYVYQSCMYKNAEVNDLCKKLVGYGNLLQQGKSIDFVEVGDIFKRLNTLFADSNGKMSEPLVIDESCFQAFVNKSANIAIDERVHEEDIRQLEEAEQNSDELSKVAKRKAEEEYNEYNKAKRESDIEPQPDSYEQDMKKKKDGEILQAQHAKSYMDRKTEFENFTRIKNLTRNAIEESRRNWQKNVFTLPFLKSLIAFNQDQERIFQSILIRLQESGLQTEQAIAQASAVMPEVLSYLKTVVTEESNALPPQEDDNAKINHYKSMAQEKREEAATYENNAADKHEEAADIRVMINNNTHGRVTGESSVSNAALRQKLKETEDSEKQNLKAANESNQQANEFEAQANHIESNRANVQQRNETVRHIEEQASAFKEQCQIHKKLKEENVQKGNSFVETINSTSGHMERIYFTAQANINNQAKEEPIKDIKESDYSKIANDEQKYDGTLDDQIQIIRHAIQRYMDRRDHLPAGHNDIPWINNMLSSLEDIVAHYESLRVNQTANSLRQQGYSVDVKTEQALKDVFRDLDMRQDPRYGAQAQQRVPTTADVKIEPSIEKTLINLQVPQYQQRNDLLNIPLSVSSSFKKKPVTPKKYKTQGGFTVGSRPDPFINRAYWKNVYQRLNK